MVTKILLQLENLIDKDYQNIKNIERDKSGKVTNVKSGEPLQILLYGKNHLHQGKEKYELCFTFIQTNEQDAENFVNYYISNYLYTILKNKKFRIVKTMSSSNPELCNQVSILI